MQSHKDRFLYNALFGFIIMAVAGIIYVILNWKEVIQYILRYFEK